MYTCPFPPGTFGADLRERLPVEAQIWCCIGTSNLSLTLLDSLYSMVPVLTVIVSRERDVSAGEHEPPKIVPIMPAMRILT